MKYTVKIGSIKIYVRAANAKEAITKAKSLAGNCNAKITGIGA